jgi:predicted  nucleic acid-binding Zn-ribbon protein
VAVQYLTDEREGLAAEVGALEARVSELTQQLAAKDAELAQAVASSASAQGGSAIGGWAERCHAAEAQLAEAQAARAALEQELQDLR